MQAPGKQTFHAMLINLISFSVYIRNQTCLFCYSSMQTPVMFHLSHACTELP